MTFTGVRRYYYENTIKIPIKYLECGIRHNRITKTINVKKKEY